MASFHSLDDTLLEQVLLRCRSSDFPALHRTCRRFRSVVESPRFRTLRIDQEWVEVQTLLQRRKRRRGEDGNAAESYYEDAKVAHNTATVVVDHCKAGTISFVSVKRMFSGFYSACDRASIDLRVLSFKFFDEYGRPKVRSLRNALGENEGNNAKPFVYIRQISWNEEYKSSSSLLGAKALRCILANSFLKDDWSICMYIPECHERIDACFLSRTKEDYDRREKLIKKRSDLVAQDARQFLRAGFLQAQDTIKTSQCVYLFAVPPFLQARDMLSQEETQSIDILEPKRRRPVDEDFFSFVSNQSYLYGNIKSELQEHSTVLQRLVENVQACNRGIEAAKENLTLLRDQVELLNHHGRRVESSPTAGGQFEERVSEMQAACQSHEVRVLQAIQRFESQLSSISPMEPLLVERTEAMRERLASFLQMFAAEVSIFKELGADLGSSNAIHACAVDVVPELIDTLLSPLSKQEVETVVNSLDGDGMTPLMRAALTVAGTMVSRVETIERLLHYGADKNIVDEGGHSALGKFYHILVAHEGAHDRALVARIRALLMPVGGPTPADTLVLHPESDDEDMLLDDLMDGDDDDDDAGYVQLYSDEDMDDGEEDGHDTEGEPEDDVPAVEE